MTQVYHLGPVHLNRGKPRGWTLILGRHAFSGGRLWLGWTPEKGEGCGRRGCLHPREAHAKRDPHPCLRDTCHCEAYRFWKWQPDGGWEFRRGAWEAGTEEWGLIPIVSGVLAAAVGLGVYLWRVLR